jgi:hypothetical protein
VKKIELNNKPQTKLKLLKLLQKEPNSTERYVPMRNTRGDLGMGKEAPEGADPQVIPAPITVPQAPITPEKQVEPVTEKLWKEMGFSRTDSKLFSNIVNGVEQGLKGKPVNDPQVRSRLSNYAYSSEKPNPQQSKVGEWLQKNKVRMQRRS